jgi:hypothetical protein
MTDLGGVVQILKKERDRLSKEIQAIGAALSAFTTAYGKGAAPRSRMSAAGKARIVAAQKLRWAKVKASAKAKAKTNGANVITVPKKRTMSVGARKKIAAAQRARWAKVKHAKKSA